MDAIVLGSKTHDYPGIDCKFKLNHSCWAIFDSPVAYLDCIKLGILETKGTVSNRLVSFL